MTNEENKDFATRYADNYRAAFQRLVVELKNTMPTPGQTVTVTASDLSLVLSALFEISPLDLARLSMENVAKHKRNIENG